MHGFEMGGMWFWWLFPVIVVILVYMAMAKKDDHSDNARKMLDKRLANGEIDEETYDRLRSKLDS